MLLAEGYNVFVTDPYLDTTVYTRLNDHIDRNVEKVSLEKGLGKADTIIFSTAHKQYRNLKVKELLNRTKKDVRIIDLWNIFQGKIENEKNIEYIGLGRGDLK